MNNNRGSSHTRVSMFSTSLVRCLEGVLPLTQSSRHQGRPLFLGFFRRVSLTRSVSLLKIIPVFRSAKLEEG